MAQRIYFKVSGEVQGVNFRWFTEKTASGLGLTGWCRNTKDGNHVEGEAQGNEDAIKLFLKAINKGPPRTGAWVSQLDKEERELKNDESGFERRQTA